MQSDDSKDFVMNLQYYINRITDLYDENLNLKEENKNLKKTIKEMEKNQCLV